MLVPGYGVMRKSWAGFIILIHAARAGFVPSGASGLTDVLEPQGCVSPLEQKVVWALWDMKPFPFYPGSAAVVSRAALSRTESRSDGNVGFY